MRGSAAVLARTLGNGRLRRVELAFAGFSLAEYAVWTAILVYAYERGGTTAAGLIAVVQLVPAALVAPFAAGLADRRGGAFALVLGYALQSLSMGAAAAVILAGGPALAVYSLAVVAASAVTLSRPAQAKVLSSLVERPEELTAATAVAGWIEASSTLLGPALGGLLIAIDGPGAVFAVFAAAVAGSTLLVVPIASAAAGGDGDGEDAQAGGVLAGIGVLRREGSSRALVLMIAAEHVAVGALDVLVVVLAISALGLGSPSAGYLNAAFGAGAAVGGFAALALAEARTITVPLLVAAAVWAAAFVALGAWQTAVAAFALLPLAGICQAVLDTAGRALLARVTPHEVLGRVFGVLEGLAMASLAVGSLLAALLVSLGGVSAALIGVAAVLVVTALVPSASLRRLDSLVPPHDAVRLLRGQSLFAALPPAVIEGLARELVRVPVRAGQVVISEGDIGDRFYLIADGDFDVSTAGEYIRTRHAGEGFGEIALLRDVLRTATVCARTSAVLYALGREPFLDALRPAI
ncbi:MAG TPA: cyclic nucleotide-binding domain-containing protein [Solirubrobacteraceae bacterium]|jgi:MFS family permease